MMLLDQVALQHKGFQLRIRYNILKPPDMGHHLLDLDSLIPAGLKILSHAVLQTDRLAHINNVVLLIMHNIYPRSCREFFQFFLYIKICVFHADNYTVFKFKNQSRNLDLCVRTGGGKHRFNSV